ncbi:hypothetical protein [Crocosphaera sp.]|uniref:hypothetical protein n=1 Tax=Crocosphaera sp. TaxID=2729996 RepID=UPI0026320416|nr:hypothetical protein [Crocosphaera sp.]MDJ0583011.1 hypothetical protein [Crocosphaera sp.]
MKVLMSADLIRLGFLEHRQYEEEIDVFWDLIVSSQIEAYMTPSCLGKILDEISENNSLEIVGDFCCNITQIIQVFPINHILYKEAEALNLELANIELALEIACAKTDNLAILTAQNFIHFCPILLQINTLNRLLKTFLVRQSLEFLYYLGSSYSSPLSISHVPLPQSSSDDTQVAITRQDKRNYSLKNLEKGRNKPKLGKKAVTIQLHPDEKIVLEHIAESFNLKHGDKGSITALLSQVAQNILMIVATPPILSNSLTSHEQESFLPSDPDETFDMSLSDIIESKEVVDDLGSGIDYLF